MPVVEDLFAAKTAGYTFMWTTSEVYRIQILGLESGRIQHILNKPDRIRTTVLFKLPDQDQDFQISFLDFDANTIIKRIFAKIERM